jgi:hypothetical protein
MVLLALVVGLVLGTTFGLLLGGLCEANGRDVATTSPAAGGDLHGDKGHDLAVSSPR